jgi:hypothetical protein
MLIKEIQKAVEVPQKKIEESIDDFTDFLSFKKNFISEPIDYLTEEEDQVGFDKFIDAIESTEKEPEKEAPDEETKMVTKSDADRNLYISAFQPFDNTDLKVIKELHKQNGNPVTLCLVHPIIDGDPEFPISQSTALEMLKSLKSSHEEIGEILEIKKPFLNTIIEKMKESGLRPILLGTSIPESDLYQKQLHYLKTQDPELDLGLIKFKMPSRDQKLLDLIRSGDYTLFKKYVPAQISSQFFDLLKSEITGGSQNLEV